MADEILTGLVVCKAISVSPQVVYPGDTIVISARFCSKVWRPMVYYKYQMYFDSNKIFEDDEFIELPHSCEWQAESYTIPSVPPGKYEVAAKERAQSYGDRKTAIIEVMQSPGPDMGKLVVYTTPSNAEIYVDGVFCGLTTDDYLSVDVAAGIHNLKVSLKGYGSIKEPFTIAEGETKTLSYNLKTTWLKYVIIGGIVLVAIGGAYYMATRKPEWVRLTKVKAKEAMERAKGAYKRAAPRLKEAAKREYERARRAYETIRG